MFNTWEERVMFWFAEHTPMDYAKGRHWTVKALALLVAIPFMPLFVVICFPLMMINLARMVWDEMK